MNPDNQVLAAAIANTFERRGTLMPTDTPLALTEEFFCQSEQTKTVDSFCAPGCCRKQCQKDAARNC